LRTCRPIMQGNTGSALASKIAVVTGGNRGLGLALCSKLRDAGYNVVLTSRDKVKGIEAVKQISSPSSPPISVYQLDLNDSGSIRCFVEDFKRDFNGKIDILINNAGIYLSNWNQEEFDFSMQTNLYGPMLLTNELLPLFLARGQGRIVNLTSTLGKLAFLSRHYRTILSPENDSSWDSLTIEAFKSKIQFMPNDQKMKGSFKPTYHISKAALNTWTRLLNARLNQEHPEKVKNVYMNACCPGWVKTDMGGSEAPLSIEEGVDTPLWLATQLPDNDRDNFSGKVWYQRKVISW
jgi:NAD(P)-dependent dehydrogenase (short-subunit alcohol dehydrogenase family)